MYTVHPKMKLSFTHPLLLMPFVLLSFLNVLLSLSE